MEAKDIMTPSPSCARTSDTAEHVAQLMRENDCGAIPVVDDSTGKLVGVVTDRDLAVRGLADGQGADTSVAKLMTVYPYAAKPDDDIERVQQLMAERKVRRVPVVDDQNRCIGIISQADL